MYQKILSIVNKIVFQTKIKNTICINDALKGR